MARMITDMETWLLDNGERKFRYLVYKRMFTPHEQQRAYIDETQFESAHYTTAYIEEAIDLGNGEWLLGLRTIVEDEVLGWIEYHKLNDIRLEYLDSEHD